nr:MAR-binding filament-like protein 1 [Ipomoea batatas]
MVSELAGEGAMRLPKPASHAELQCRLRRQIRSSLRRGVFPAKTVALFNPSTMFIPLSLDGSSRSRSVEISSRVLVNPLFAVFNRTSQSRFVRSSAELVIPLFDLVSLSKVLVISLFTVFIRSRSAKILSAELVAVVSSPQRRTREKKQLITPIRDFASEKSQGERRVSDLKNRVGKLRSEIEIEAPTANIEEAIKWKRFQGAVAEIDLWSRSMDTNLCSVFSKPESAISPVSEMSFSSTLSSRSAMVKVCVEEKNKNHTLDAVLRIPSQYSARSPIASRDKTNCENSEKSAFKSNCDMSLQSSSINKYNTGPTRIGTAPTPSALASLYSVTVLWEA